MTAGRGRQVQVRPERVGGVRRPGLPGGDHLGRLRPGPGQEEEHRRRGGHGAEVEIGGDAEVAAAAAAAGPVEVASAAVGAGGQRPAVRRDDVQRLPACRRSARRPGRSRRRRRRGPGRRCRRSGRSRRARRGPWPPGRCRSRSAGCPRPRSRSCRRPGTPLRFSTSMIRPVLDRVAGVAVPAGAGGELDAELADERQAGRHVVRVLHVGDPGRVAPVEPRVEQAAVAPCSCGRPGGRACPPGHGRGRSSRRRVGPAARAPMPMTGARRARSGCGGWGRRPRRRPGTATAATPPAAAPRNARRFTEGPDEVSVTSVRTPRPGPPVAMKPRVRRKSRAQTRAYIGMSDRRSEPCDLGRVMEAGDEITRGAGTSHLRRPRAYLRTRAHQKN